MDEPGADAHTPEEFSPLAGIAPPCARTLRARDGGGEGSGTDPYRLEVRPADAAGRERARELMHLLAALEIAGCTAAPMVLEVEETGHVRETAPPQRLGGGRRRDASAEPPTAERLALAAAREALDQLLGELHARGWVLGAPDGEGIGLRLDGSVLVRDLEGLHRSDSLSERAADRRWVDTVLRDQDRTLRRRVDTLGSIGAGSNGVASIGVSSVGVGSIAAEGVGAGMVAGGGAADGPSPVSVPVFAPASASVSVPAPAGADSAGAGGPREGDALLRRPLRSTSRDRRTGRRRRTLRARLAALRSGLDGHRMVLRGGIIAVLLLAMAGLGFRWSGPEPNTPPAAMVAGETADGQSQGGQENGPVIADPWELGAELAGARHAYVTGLSSTPVSPPGSAALEADDALRATYSGIRVHGGGPVVHAAEIVEGPTESGRAVLSLEISSAPVQLEDAEGALTDFPATDPATVLLHLRWEDGAWLVTEVERVEGGGAA